MSGVIHFVSGKTLPISDTEMRTIIPQLISGGIRVKTLESGIIPLNSNTIEYIEDLGADEMPVMEPNKDERNYPKPVKPVNEEIEKKKSDEEKSQELMDEMTAKSNCSHPAETMEIWMKTTTKGIRYFPVCGFCGKRERYVKVASLTEEQKESAKEWVD